MTSESERTKQLSADNVSLTAEVAQLRDRLRDLEQLSADNARLAAEVAQLRNRLRELEDARLSLTEKAARAEGGLAACEQHIKTLATALDVERLRGELERAKEHIAVLEQQARDHLVRITTFAAPLPREAP